MSVCTKYSGALASLLSGLGELPKPDDFSLCLDYEHLGARSQEQCSPGFRYVPVKSGAGGLCVGSCRKGDTPVVRTFSATYEGQEHQISLPVCHVQPQGIRGLTRAVRASGGLSFFQLILLIIVGLWAYNTFFKAS